MELEPNKRVGVPASFKGVRGPFLMSLIFWTVAILFSIFILTTITKDKTITFSVILIGIGASIFKYLELKKASKGDLNIHLKKRCRRNLRIISNQIRIKS